MKKIFFAALLVVSGQALAITRVVNCHDQQTNNLEMQIELRGGNANIYLCKSDVCTDMNLTHVQNLVLNQTNPSEETLHYVPVNGSTPVQSTLEILFQGQVGDPVQVKIDGASTGFRCI